VKQPPLISIALLVACASAANAQQVYRCLDAAGARVYADRACVHLGLESQSPTPGAAGPADLLPGEWALEAETGPASASEGCPGPSPEALRDGVLAAIGTRDLNGLTGMYHWAGAGRRTATEVIARMQSLIAAAPQAAELRQPDANDDWLWARLPPPSAAADPDLVLLSTAGAFDPVARFQLRMQAGCYWLADR
jgi:hypothetical protein